MAKQSEFGCSRIDFNQANDVLHLALLMSGFYGWTEVLNMFTVDDFLMKH